MKYLVAILMTFLTYSAIAADPFESSLAMASSAMRLQNERLKVIAENIANIDVAPSSIEVEPYRRKIITVQQKYDPQIGKEMVAIDAVMQDNGEFLKKYQPSHPAADRAGYVLYPNVNAMIEMVDAKSAKAGFEAAVSGMEITKSNQILVIDLMK
jgi:flagellar basal-body rod protein FlgC